jgi:hypothetical protein
MESGCWKLTYREEVLTRTKVREILTSPVTGRRARPARPDYVQTPKIVTKNHYDKPE